MALSSLQAEFTNPRTARRHDRAIAMTEVAAARAIQWFTVGRT